MLKRLYRLILVLLILALALYIVLLNTDAVTLKLGNQQTFSASLGAMVIFVFASGVVFTAFVASIFGFKAYLKERGFLASERRRLDFASDSAKARSLTVAGQYVTARRLWETLIKRDSSDVQSRLWLAKTLEEEGNLNDALKIVDAARSAFPGDCEVLFRAAAINKRLGNKTAAIDNLALVMVNQPSEKAARQARDLSVELGRLSDALEYNTQLEKMGANKKELREFEAKIRLSLLQTGISSDDSQFDPQYVKALKDLIRDFPESSAALVAIAEIEKKEGDFEAASQALVKAAVAEQSVDGWRRPIELWIARKQPERALAVARLAIKESGNSQRNQFELMLARLYVQFGMFSDARSLLETLAKNSNEQSIKQQTTALLGRCLLAAGQEKEAADLWRTLAD